MDNTNCQNYKIYNHLEDKSVGMSVWEFLDWASWDGKDHPKYGWHHSMSQHLGLTKKGHTNIQLSLLPNCSLNATFCLMFLSPCLLCPNGLHIFILWSRRNPFFSCLHQVLVTAIQRITDISTINESQGNSEKKEHCLGPQHWMFLVLTSFS